MIRPVLKDVMAALSGIPEGVAFYVALYPNGWSAGRSQPSTDGVLVVVREEMGRDRRKTIRKALSRLERTMKLRDKEKKHANRGVGSSSPLHS